MDAEGLMDDAGFCADPEPMVPRSRGNRRGEKRSLENERRDAARVAKAKSLGMCRGCFKAKAAADRAICENCRRVRDGRVAALKLLGICTKCRTRKASRDLLICGVCRIKSMAERARKKLHNG